MKYGIREIARADISMINSWRNDREVIDLLGNNFLYIDQEIDDRWFDYYLQNRSTAVRLAIVDISCEKMIGTVQLTNIHPINRSAEFSIMIGDKNYWNRGAGRFSSEEMLRHGFDNLNLHRIFLTVLEHNLRAIALYKKVGFSQEGIQREAIYKNGEFLSLIQMSVLKREKKYEHEKGL